MNIHSFIKNHPTLSSQNRFRIETHRNRHINKVKWGTDGHLSVTKSPDSVRQPPIFKNEFIFMLMVSYRLIIPWSRQTVLGRPSKRLLEYAGIDRPHAGLKQSCNYRGFLRRYSTFGKVFRRDAFGAHAAGNGDPAIVLRLHPDKGIYSAAIVPAGRATHSDKHYGLGISLSTFQ